MRISEDGRTTSIKRPVLGLSITGIGLVIGTVGRLLLADDIIFGTETGCELRSELGFVEYVELETALVSLPDPPGVFAIKELTARSSSSKSMSFTY
jgi:hypothetical protein